MTMACLSGKGHGKNLPQHIVTETAGLSTLYLNVVYLSSQLDLTCVLGF